MNVLDKLPRTRQAEARSLLTKIPYAATREQAERQKQAFQAWCAKRGLAEVAVRGGATADGGGQAVQKGGERDRGDLEDAAGGRAHLPASRCARVASRCRGVEYVNGVRAVNRRDEKAAA